MRPRGSAALPRTEAASPDGPQAIVPYSYAGTMGLLQGSSMDRRFFHRLGASRLERVELRGVQFWFRPTWSAGRDCQVTRPIWLRPRWIVTSASSSSASSPANC